MNKKALYFTSDIYNQEYFFLKYWSREQFEKVIGVDLSNSGGMTVFKDGVIYIWVESLEGQGVSHLVHECLHATNFTLGSRGVKVSAKDDEAQAYLIQWIFDNCFQSLKKIKK